MRPTNNSITTIIRMENHGGERTFFTGGKRGGGMRNCLDGVLMCNNIHYVLTLGFLTPDSCKTLCPDSELSPVRSLKPLMDYVFGSAGAIPGQGAENIPVCEQRGNQSVLNPHFLLLLSVLLWAKLLFGDVPTAISFSVSRWMLTRIVNFVSGCVIY